ncbi:MAG: L,D-transpeptidase [Chloroflexota bacterium]|nr:MAG: L,D-transpeptidase [Chloroflexota bacterium]
MVRAARLTAIVGGLIVFLFMISPADAGSCFYYSPDVGYVCDGRLEPAVHQFEEPVLPEESLLDRATYAYMEDNINIYPEPNLGLAPLHNVGEGFLYVTIQGEVEANGHRWYEVNPGEYALAEDIRLVETPDFNGVVVNVQPERPFGWIVQEIRPSSEPDGEPNPDFEKLERFDFFQVYDAAVGEDEWIWYEIGDGRWVRQTQVSLVDVDEPPEEVGEGEFWAEVDLYEQTYAAYEGTRMVYATLISSGLNRWPTREGLFQVWIRYYQTRMSGAEGKVDYYFIEDVPYTMYFDRHNEIALHGAFWHDRYGFKHSHGCVNMPPRDAEWTYYWSADAPNDLWVWVHTAEPMDYFSRFAVSTES